MKLSRFHVHYIVFKLPSTNQYNSREFNKFEIHTQSIYPSPKSHPNMPNLEILLGWLNWCMGMDKNDLRLRDFTSFKLKEQDWWTNLQIFEISFKCQNFQQGFIKLEILVWVCRAFQDEHFGVKRFWFPWLDLKNL